jgi:hypothetical protein
MDCLAGNMCTLCLGQLNLEFAHEKLRGSGKYLRESGIYLKIVEKVGILWGKKIIHEFFSPSHWHSNLNGHCLCCHCKQTQRGGQPVSQYCIMRMISMNAAAH